MALFVLKRGKHIEGGVTYDSKDRNLNVVESDDDLVKKFGYEKFGRMENDEFSSAQRKAKKAKARKAEPEEEEGDDDAIVVQDPPKSAKAAKGKKASKKKVDLGDDVTDKFADAEEAGYTVHHDGERYHVVDANDPSTPLNDDELTTKKAVREFIATYSE